jgi:hypothetical protein
VLNRLLIASNHHELNDNIKSLHTLGASPLGFAHVIANGSRSSILATTGIHAGNPILDPR